MMCDFPVPEGPCTNKNLNASVSSWSNGAVVSYGHESPPLEPRNLHNRVTTSPRQSQRFFSCSNVVPSVNTNLDGADWFDELLKIGSGQTGKPHGFIE
jgi:hypothetical protein